MAGKVTKDTKIQKFINDVMNYAESRVDWDVNSNPIRTHAKVTMIGASNEKYPASDKRDDGTVIQSENYGALGKRGEPQPSVNASNSTFRHIDSQGGTVTAAALAQIFQSFAYNVTRYRRVRMRVKGTDGMANVEFGVKVAALKDSHRMNEGSFKSQVNSSPGINNLSPGNALAEQALDNLIVRLRSIITSNTSSGTYLTIAACHSSCHGSCHGSRNRR